MPLIHILEMVKSDIGFNLNNPDEKTLFTSKINKAAEELYQSTDLYGCLREQVFDLDFTHKQIVLPYYVFHIRGARHYNSMGRIKLEDMRPRYFYGRWTQPSLQWRVKHYSAIGKDLENAGPITFEIPMASPESYNIYISGSTTMSERIDETIVVDAGDTGPFTSVNSYTEFPGIKRIAKNKITTHNITIRDINGELLGMIPNHEFESKYTLIQVTDNVRSESCNCYEILYKWKFSPFFNDYDEFPCENHDDVIAWQTLAHYYSTNTDEESRKKAAYFQAMISGKLIPERNRDGDDSVEKEMQIAPGRLLEIHKLCSPYYGPLWR